MRPILKYILGVLPLSAALFSCSVSSNDIRVDGAPGIEVSGVTLSQARLVLRMTLANDSRARLTVKDGQLAIKDAKGQIAEVLMDESVVLRRKSSAEIALPLTIRFNGAFGSATAARRLAVDPANLLVDGYIHVKGGAFGRKIQVKDMTVEEFLGMLGIYDTESLHLFD